MSDKHIDEIFRELQDELNAVQPSPEFAAKVRAQVAAQPVRGWWRGWQGIAATAAAVLVGAVGLIVVSRQPDGPLPAVARPDVRVAETVMPQVPATAVPELLRSAPVRASARKAPGAAVVGSAAREPEVLVPSDQMLSVRRALMQAQRGLFGAPPARAVTGEELDELLPVMPIQIPLLSVQPMVAAGEGRGGGSRYR